MKTIWKFERQNDLFGTELISYYFGDCIWFTIIHRTNMVNDVCNDKPPIRSPVTKSCAVHVCLF